jgi:UPF0716 protein FxsA
VLLTLAALFTTLLVAELYLVITLGMTIGWLPTLLIAVVTGMAGVALARAQGVATLTKLSNQMRAGEPPNDTILDGAIILFAGFLLMMPGVITDVLGLLLLIPPVRTLLKPMLRNAEAQNCGPGVRVWTYGSTIGSTGSSTTGTAPPQKDRIIEAEVIDVRTRNIDE